MRSSIRFVVLCILLGATLARAAETEKKYLSGLGKDDPVQWQFMCDKGQNAGKWSTIGVPSNWQLQGFGIYEYGQPKPAGGWPRVHGIYKRTFSTPASWRTKTVFIDFEGVMTDTRVTINGQSAGPIHQGGYYAFKYDITKLLKPAGEKNEIQVDVDDDSMNDSVNRAERRADYWNYGGIFRPVYLEAVPKTFIDHIAISATADGALSVAVTAMDTRAGSSKPGRASLEAHVLDKLGKPVGYPLTAKDITFDEVSYLSGRIPHPRLWTAETPNLYELEVQLKMDGTAVHTIRQRFGFRTIEVRPGLGLFVNGNRVFLKGFARHSFWPDSGRTLSVQISREDIDLIKEMNGNAVRSSHYPPDGHFLDACDELGLYVLDELGGWHGHYDTEIGKKLVKEMVEHDVNHPSILFWDNGNEGGFNPDLDGEFAKYDPQKRVVLHPWTEYPPGIADTKHYPTYDQLLQKLSEPPVFFPTEMLHGLYDGGSGASLNEYWDAILKSKAGAGGFLWSYVDEDIKRVDKGGILDSAGNQAPDGILGPYREKEGSFYTVKAIWSPIIVTPPDGSSRSYTVANRYSFTNADQCTYKWELIAFRKPDDAESGSIVLASRTDHGSPLAPGVTAAWGDWGPPSLPRRERDKETPDAIRLRIKDPAGRVIQTYVWPTAGLATRMDLADHFASGTKPSVTESADALKVSAGDLTLQISKATGLLVSESRAGESFWLANGPRVVAMTPRLPPPPRRKGGKSQVPASPPPTFAPESQLTSVTHKMDGPDLVISVEYSGPMKSLSYRIRSNGWLTIHYKYSLSGEQEYFGVGFDYPEAKINGMRYLGDGPSTVYKNRLQGGTLDVWNKHYNNTMVGDPDDLKPGQHFDYPVFKGFYSGVRWLKLNTTDGPITAIVNQPGDSPQYVQVFSPKMPREVGQAFAPFPDAGISFLQAIPAVGSKFTSPRLAGPMGQPTLANGQYDGTVSLYFGKE